MKKIVLFIIGLLNIGIGFSQNKVKVFDLPGLTALIIPFEDKFILEEHSNIKFYQLLSADTLDVINDSIFLKSVPAWANIDLFTKEYDFCDPKINKIRNSSLSYKIYRMLHDTITKYIGRDYINLNLTFEYEYKKNVCSDTFSILIYEQFYAKINKIKEIYESKVQRTDWIKKNIADINKDYIALFLADFDNNEPDIEAFTLILITNPVSLVEEIDKFEYSYQFISRVKWIKNTNGFSQAIESLENTDLKGKTKRQLLKELKIE